MVVVMKRVYDATTAGGRSLEAKWGVVPDQPMLVLAENVVAVSEIAKIRVGATEEDIQEGRYRVYALPFPAVTLVG
jgi:hypothetical protein